MALTGALYTALSGLDAAQTTMNVVGNNIANANTVAFKSSRALFQPQFYVTDAGGSAPSTNFGGTNPVQEGLGAATATIEQDFTPGSLEPTGVPTDLAIDGQGFFVVQGQTQQFTRDGSFSLNASDQLVTNNGDFVQGYGVDANFQINPTQLTNITIPLGALTSAKATTTANFTGNLNASGAVATGASIIDTQSIQLNGGGVPASTDLLTNLVSTSAPGVPLFTSGQTLTLNGQKGGGDLAPSTFTVTGTTTVQDLLNFYNNALGINTTVAPTSATVPTPGAAIATDPTDPTSAQIFIMGNTGSANSLSLTGSSFVTAGGTSPFTYATGTDPTGTIQNDPNGESVNTSLLAYDSLGTPINISVTAVYESSSTTGNVWRFEATSPDSLNGNNVVGTGTITFNSAGQLISSSGTNISIDRTGTGAATPMSVALDFSGMTSLSSTTSQLVNSKQDGSAIGTLNSFGIGTDGVITGAFSNGLTKTLGQVAVATFNNNNGLVNNGGNLYGAGANSGAPIIGAPGQEGSGLIRSGTLELSNVDLSKEFINMISASTGFSASSRVISTSQQLLTDLLNSSQG